MNGSNHIARFSVPFCLLFLTLVPVGAQELGPNDIDPKTEDTRCIEKNYRHKTARELARMTAEQLIDESVRHWNYHVALMDKYGMFTLDSYTEKIGTEIIPLLSKLAGNFASRPLSRCQQERFFTAFAIAVDVDDQKIRLRTAKGGESAISAAADAIQKMKDAGLADHNAHPLNKYAFGLHLLDSVRGVNEHDKLIRKLLNAEFGLQLSDEEFVNFVQFLTSTYATYPSWTPRVKMSRDLRPSKKRYYDAYQQFKESKKFGSGLRFAILNQTPPDPGFDLGTYYFCDVEHRELTITALNEICTICKPGPRELTLDFRTLWRELLAKYVQHFSGQSLIKIVKDSALLRLRIPTQIGSL